MRRAALTMALVAALAAPAAAARARDDGPRSVDELRAAVAHVLAREGVPGVGLALVRDGRVEWAGGVGLADREAGRPVTADTLFRVGSITKSVVALALVKLSEQGRIDLHARVADLAPEVAIGNRWAAEAPITVAHLVEHTAGFDDMRPNEMYSPVEAETIPLAEVLARNPRSRVARWRPGTHFSYANPGYTVAAYLIEKVTGRRYEDYVRDEILRPLGIDDAALAWSPEVEARLARGYDDRGARVPYAAIWHRPAGNLMASPRDVARLVQLFLARGRVDGRALVSADGVARMERSETGPLAGTDVAYGLGNYGMTFGRVVLRGHDGGIDGFLSRYAYSTAANVGFVVLLDSTRSWRAGLEISQLALAYLLRGRRVPPPPPRVRVPDGELAAWAGSYRVDNPRMQLFAWLHAIAPRVVVAHAAGRLVVRVPGVPAPIELVPLGADRFRLAGSSGCDVRFGRDRDGRRALYSFFGEFVDEPAWLGALACTGARAAFWIVASALLLPFVWLAARVRGKRTAPGALVRFVAAAALYATPFVLDAGARAHALGAPNRYTIAISALTGAFALAALGSLVSAMRARTVGWAARLYALAFALAASSLTALFAWYGVVGIRLWRW